MEQNIDRVATRFGLTQLAYDESIPYAARKELRERLAMDPLTTFFEMKEGGQLTENVKESSTPLSEILYSTILPHLISMAGRTAILRLLSSCREYSRLPFHRPLLDLREIHIEDRDMKRAFVVRRSEGKHDYPTFWKSERLVQMYGFCILYVSEEVAVLMGTPLRPDFIRARMNGPAQERGDHDLPVTVFPRVESIRTAIRLQGIHCPSLVSFKGQIDSNFIRAHQTLRSLSIDNDTGDVLKDVSQGEFPQLDHLDVLHHTPISAISEGVICAHPPTTSLLLPAGVRSPLLCARLPGHISGKMNEGTYANLMGWANVRCTWGGAVPPHALTRKAVLGVERGCDVLVCDQGALTDHPDVISVEHGVMKSQRFKSPPISACTLISNLIRHRKSVEYLHIDGCTGEPCPAEACPCIDVAEVRVWMRGLKGIHVHTICRSLNDMLLSLGFEKRKISACCYCDYNTNIHPISYEYSRTDLPPPPPSHAAIDSILLSRLRPTAKRAQISVWGEGGDAYCPHHTLVRRYCQSANVPREYWWGFKGCRCDVDWDMRGEIKKGFVLISKRKREEG
eukprot:GHVO01046597.1.p1 GENE.GHVO01046597.1~~GHVO01046597.1.p1  ORF type:complete len:566 (-),score=104.30 GHVO01046597.1:296-1993(-)